MNLKNEWFGWVTDGIMIIHSLTTWSHYQLERLIGMASTRTENV